ncbi:MAG: PhnE/PtxC family ABC transporter permease [Planctomycetota bacterium]|jgi:phosphonate transport system permease protein
MRTAVRVPEPAASGWRSPVVLLVLLAVALLWALWAGEYDLSVFIDPVQRSSAVSRLGEFLGAFLSPDLSGSYLARCVELAGDTLAIAFLGTALAVVGGLALAICSSRNALFSSEGNGRSGLRRLIRETFRVLQDVLRGVPDFAWAVIFIPLVGLGPAAGILAIFVNVSGILARVYSELFDALPASRLEPLRSAGVGRLRSVFYAVLPSVRSPFLSFTLLRWECSVRNAAVIGAVGGGGLGSEVIHRLGYGEYGKVMTVMVFLLILTMASDQISRIVRAAFAEAGRRTETQGLADARRRLLLLAASVALALGLSFLWVMPSLTSGHRTGLLERLGEAQRIFGDLLSPDLSYLGQGLSASAVTLSMALIATFLATLAAAALAAPASRILGMAPWIGGVLRFAATISRTIPEVFWALLLVSFLRHGSLPGMLALALHSGGLLLRLFTESVDAIPQRQLDAVRDASASRSKTFVYAVLPRVAPHWIANAFFQLESNVRTSIVLGIVGAAGLGFQFKYAFEWFHFREAGTYLVLMVSFALLLDRLSRSLGFARARLG